MTGQSLYSDQSDGMVGVLQGSTTTVANTKRRPSASGEETRAKIISATLSTLKSEGIVGTSARAIARRGDFNQALIFYHFGSIDELIIAAVADMSRERRDRHGARLDEVQTLTELIQVARELHDDDHARDNMTVLTQAFAGASGHAELGPKLYAELEPWSELVASTIERVVKEVPGAAVVPHHQIAQAISALFLGIELLDDLDPTRANVDELFDTLESLSRILENLMQTPLLQALAGGTDG